MVMVLLGAVLLLLLAFVPAVLETLKPAEQLYEQIHAKVGRRFFDPARMQDWSEWKKKFTGQIKNREDCVKYANEMLNSLNDPYTKVYGPKQLRENVSYEANEFFTLGLTLAAAYEINPDTCPEENQRTGVSCSNPTIVGVAANSPAALAGLKAGDILLSINGTVTDGKNLAQVQEELYGRVGSLVTIEVLSDGTKRQIELRRSFVGRPTAIAKMLTGEIGYLRITHFDANTDADTARQARKIRTSAALVLDLRDNPGGDYYAAIRTAGLFFKSGVVAHMVSRVRGAPDKPVFVRTELSLENGVVVERSIVEGDTSARKPVYGDPSQSAPPLFVGIPVVVLVNENTASAAETLTGAVRDTAHGTTLGTKTFGKGVGQVLFNVSRRVIVRVTTFKTIFPSGLWVGNGAEDRRGHEPDVTIARQETLYDFGSPRDQHLQQAIELLKAKKQ